MISTVLLVTALQSGAPQAPADAAPAAETPRGWEVNKAADQSVTWAAPRGWKLSRQLPVGAAPSSLTFELKTKGQAQGWLTVEALVSGNGTPEEILAKRPAGVTNVTTEDGWTCGEEPDGGAEVVCASTGDLVTTVVELGGGSSRAVSRVGGVAALRKAARLFQGVWPKGLPQPDPAGHLPTVDWSESNAQDGRVAWMAPSGWAPTDPATRSAEAPPAMMSFNAPAGTGGFSIAALPGLADATPDQLPAAEARIIKLLIADPVLTRADGWTCGEGNEKSSGLPAVICNRTTQEMSLYVSARAEAAVFQTLGGAPAVRAAAQRVKGFAF